MGTTTSKFAKDEPLRLCRERKRFIKQAIDSRYDLAASHVAYTNSLKNIGAALWRYAEGQNLIEPSAGEVGKTTPLHSSYHPSPSPVHNAEVLEASSVGETAATTTTTVNCMRSDGGVAVCMSFSPAISGFLDEENFGFSMPPPPPPLPEIGSSWDYFDTSDNIRRFDRNADAENVESGQFSESRTNVDIEKVVVLGHEGEALGVAGHSATSSVTKGNCNAMALGDTECDKVEDLLREREDPSEFITHRAKDFLSCIKDIEHRFFRASEAGREVSRLLEANKIRVGYSKAKGSSASSFMGTFGVVCCRGRRTSLVSNEVSQGKVITWNRTTSSRSSSSKNPLTTGSKDENDDSESEFGEEFCMFAGSHSSTLERLFAWERKLYDEVKASEIIMKEYDIKCHLLRRQFAKDVSSHVIDKTRAAIKDLHSRIQVALHACNSISKRIEKMRDEELLPQLVELVQGLTRMWKVMLECHHAQYIAISLAYHKKSTTETPLNDYHREILSQLREEVECFGLSFTNWITSHTSYVESLNGYIQNCIMLPQERSKGRRAFSPRRVLAPPIFVLIRDWSVGVQSLPVIELCDAIKHFLTDIDQVTEQQDKEEQKKQKSPPSRTELKSSSKFIQSSLAKVLDKLTKFSEASVKMCEEVRQKSESARVAYTNFRQVRV